MTVKVSAIVPVYNAQVFIGKCIEALLDQTYNIEDYEIIVVDDGSNDRTCSIVKSYPVKYIYQENYGPATARNKGAEKAKGEIILFTDSDCVPDRNWIMEMLKPFESPGVIAVKGAYRTEQRSVVARFSQLEFEERFDMLKKAESIDMVDTYSAGYRKEVFLKMGGFDTSFPVANNEDTDLSYRMSEGGHKMVFNPDAIVYHLKHPDSIKEYARLKFWRGYWRMIVYKKFSNKMVKDTYTPQALKLQILSLFLLVMSVPFALLCQPYGVYLLSFVVVLLGLLLLPFTVGAIKKDPFVGTFTPFLLIVRAVSIGLGILYYYTIKTSFFRKFFSCSP